MPARSRTLGSRVGSRSAVHWRDRRFSRGDVRVCVRPPRPRLMLADFAERGDRLFRRSNVQNERDESLEFGRAEVSAAGLPQEQHEPCVRVAQLIRDDKRARAGLGVSLSGRFRHHWRACAGWCVHSAIRAVWRSTSRFRRLCRRECSESCSAAWRSPLANSSSIRCLAISRS